jgi:hypothetical protein
LEAIEMSLYGKGYFLWKIPHVMGGDPAAIAAKAEDAGLSHVLIKIADGADWVYNYNYDDEVDLVPPVRDALREAGMFVWGWHYVRGDDPVAEAHLAVQRMRELNLDGYVIDAEGEYKERGKTAAARRFMEELRDGLPKTPIAFSSYRFPLQHPSIPFDTFLEKCDYAMPQVYFEQAHNPESQIQRSVDQYMSLEQAKPIISTGPAYSNEGWTPTADEITRFMVKVKELGQPAVNFWSFDYVLRSSMVDIWHAIASFDWPFEPPKSDLVEQLIGRMNQRDNMYVSGLYHDNAAHITGARAVVGRDAIAQWYNVVFTQLLPDATFELTGKSGTGNSRHFTWTATSQNGEVLDGNDTLGIRDGSIQYHYTYFTIT